MGAENTGLAISPLAVEASLRKLMSGSKGAAVVGLIFFGFAALYVLLQTSGTVPITTYISLCFGMIGMFVSGSLILGRSLMRAKTARRMLARLGDPVTFTLHERTLTCSGPGGDDKIVLMYREKLLLEQGGIPVARLHSSDR